MTTTITIETFELAAAASSPIILIILLTVVVLLVQKEVASTLDQQRTQRWNRALTIVLVPLVLVFVVAIISRVAEALR